MIWWLNAMSCTIVLAVCMWAVLTPEVPTRIVGTVLISALGIFSVLNMIKPGFAGIFSAQSQTFVNMSLACLAIWFYVRYQIYLNEIDNDGFR